MKSSKFKYGQAREDGKVFLAYRRVAGRAYEHWLSRAVFESRKQRERLKGIEKRRLLRQERLKWLALNPKPEKSKTPTYSKPESPKYGDIRHDGFSFVSFMWRNGKWNEKWESPAAKPKRVDKYRIKARAAAKRRSQSPELLKVHAEKEAIRRKNPEYQKQQTKYKNAWTQQRTLVDPAFKLLRRYRKRLWDAIKHNTKPARTQEIVGITPEGLKAHLESLWTPGMSWDNYTHSGWHVDHIVPCSQFDFSDPEQIRQCFHYTNLQPLWAQDNYRKNTKKPKTA